MQTMRELKISYGQEIELEFPKVTCSDNAQKALRKIWEQDITMIERFYCLFLNNSNKIIGYKNISMGGLTSTSVDSRIIFSHALKSLATGVILAHNHPSGSFHPSHADKQLTKRITEGGKILDIHVVDHVILTEDSYFSFIDEGLL